MSIITDSDSAFAEFYAEAALASRDHINRVMIDAKYPPLPFDIAPNVESGLHAFSGTRCVFCDIHEDDETLRPCNY